MHGSSGAQNLIAFTRRLENVGKTLFGRDLLGHRNYPRLGDPDLFALFTLWKALVNGRMSNVPTFGQLRRVIHYDAHAIAERGGRMLN